MRYASEHQSLHTHVADVFVCVGELFKFLNNVRKFMPRAGGEGLGSRMADLVADM